jgi:hypothetical protein
MQSKRQIEVCDADGDETTLTTGSQVLAKIWKWKEAPLVTVLPPAFQFVVTVSYV